MSNPLTQEELAKHIIAENNCDYISCRGLGSALGGLSLNHGTPCPLYNFAPGTDLEPVGCSAPGSSIGQSAEAWLLRDRDTVCRVKV